MQGNIRKGQNIRKYWNMLESVRKCQKMLKNALNVRKHWNMLEYVRKCQKTLENARKR